MNCLLFRLRFDTPVHFGSPDSALSLYASEDHFRADTLFSALCHTALQLYGEEGVNSLVQSAQKGELLLSDSMPWTGNTYYVPKPCYSAQTKKELPADKRKAMKKLAWIPVERLGEYCSALKTGALFAGEQVAFGKHSESVKAAMLRQDEAMPYPVGLFQFRENCGLYFIAATAEGFDIARLEKLVKVLGVSGIGGKVTSGYGKFTVEQSINLKTLPHWAGLSILAKKKPSAYMLLTTSLPREEELETALEGAGYQLVRRAGFVASDGGAGSPRKKQTQHYLGAGAVVKTTFSGDVYEIGHTGTHAVYRYSKPLFMGVEL